jgi:hypothetical protein
VRGDIVETVISHPLRRWLTNGPQNGLQPRISRPVGLYWNGEVPNVGGPLRRTKARQCDKAVVRIPVLIAAYSGACLGEIVEAHKRDFEVSRDSIVFHIRLDNGTEALREVVESLPADPMKWELE